MKKFSKIIALGLATTIMGGALIGCGRKQPKVQEEESEYVVAKVEKELAKEEQQAVTIRTVSQFGGTDPAADIYEEKLEQFRSETPNITVEDESGTADQAWKAKVATDFLASNEPDVIFTFTGVDAKLIIEQGKVVTIEEIRKEYPSYASNINEGVLKLVEEFDGNTYAVPVRGSYEGLFVNKAIFKEHGLELPTDWIKLQTAITTLNEKGMVPIAVALGHMPHHWIEHLILSQGGVDVHKNTDIAAVKEDWVKGLEYFQTLHELNAFPKDTNSTNNNRVIEMFKKGEAAMLLDRNGVIDGFKNPDDMTVLPLPTVLGGKKDPSDIISEFSAGWYITKKAWDDPVKRGAAVRFVEKMTSTETIRDFVALGGVPSADVGDVEGLSATAIEGFKMQGAAKNMDLPIDTWLSKPAWDKLVSKIPSIAIGQDDPASVVEEIIVLSKD